MSCKQELISIRLFTRTAQAGTCLNSRRAEGTKENRTTDWAADKVQSYGEVSVQEIGI
jgi:hypothetical protein